MMYVIKWYPLGIPMVAPMKDQFYMIKNSRGLSEARENQHYQDEAFN